MTNTITEHCTKTAKRTVLWQFEEMIRTPLPAFIEISILDDALAHEQQMRGKVHGAEDWGEAEKNIGNRSTAAVVAGRHSGTVLTFVVSGHVVANGTQLGPWGVCKHIVQLQGHLSASKGRRRRGILARNKGVQFGALCNGQ